LNLTVIKIVTFYTNLLFALNLYSGITWFESHLGVLWVYSGTVCAFGHNRCSPLHFSNSTF